MQRKSSGESELDWQVGVEERVDARVPGRHDLRGGAVLQHALFEIAFSSVSYIGRESLARIPNQGSGGSSLTNSDI